MGFRLLLEASLVEAFLPRKLEGHGTLTDRRSEVAIRESLEAMARAIREQV